MGHKFEGKERVKTQDRLRLMSKEVRAEVLRRCVHQKRMCRTKNLVQLYVRILGRTHGWKSGSGRGASKGLVGGDVIRKRVSEPGKKRDSARGKWSTVSNAQRLRGVRLQKMLLGLVMKASWSSSRLQLKKIVKGEVSAQKMRKDGKGSRGCRLFILHVCHSEL